MSIYTATVFTSAFLLLLVQPILSKLMLPSLGGSPAVWNTAMMFFQTILLLGYAYAHWLTESLNSRKQALMHSAIALATLLWLPLSLYTNLDFSSSEKPIHWVLASLFFSIGVPFFLMASNAPLIQSWFAAQPQNKGNPYTLYSISSAGSLIALLCYPFMVEPLLTLPQQTMGWTALYLLFIGLLLICAARHYRAPQMPAPASLKEKPVKDFGWGRRFYWLALAFVPSSLLQGVTMHITTDIASMPLFWVLPLSLYLLTFVFAFSDNSRCVSRALKAQLWVMPAGIILMGVGGLPFMISMTIQLLMFFVITLCCHGTLYRMKPNAAHLTEFYLWLSLGGMIGGVFNSLIAPVIFKTPIEYLLALSWAAMLRPSLKEAHNPKLYFGRWRDLIIPLILLVIIIDVIMAYRYLAPPPSGGGLGNWLSGKKVDASLADPGFAIFLKWAAVSIVFMSAWICSIKMKNSTRGFTLIIAILLLSSPQLLRTNANKSWDMKNISTQRNFFGVKRVTHSDSLGVTLLMQGTTLHGIQGHEEDERLVPAAYYGALKEILASLPEETRRQPFSVLGLGAGTLACYGQKGQQFDLYEIDPQIVDIALKPEYFTYLRDCEPESNIILGDGRLKMQEAQDGKYGMMVMDAFTSDAIPVHLLTTEAMKIYISKLAPEGVMAFNVSNRHLNLSKVMAALADDNGLVAYQKNFRVDYSRRLTLPSQWIVMARQQSDLGSLLKDTKGWKRIQPQHGQRPWTDNYSNIFQTLFK